MKVCQVNYYDSGSGAALAAYRLHHNLWAAGINSQFLAAEKRTADTTVMEITTPWQRCRLHFYQHLAALLLRLQQSRNPLPHSLGCLGCGLGKHIAAVPADLINLHWINGEMLSVWETAALAARRPVVWTFHDAWPICGAEHHSLTNGNNRYREGYTKFNAEDPGFDWDRRIWQIKRRCWAEMKIHIVTPSTWLADRVKDSILFSGSPVTIIPNGIDLRIFTPGDRAESRTRLGLPSDKKLIGFGAIGLNDPNKGGSELMAALTALAENNRDFELVMVGNGRFSDSLPLKAHYLGMLDKTEKMVDFYRSCDVFVLASKQDNLPNMMMEALACGTPGVAFATGGLPEMITHEESGYLSRCFDPLDLVAGIKWVIANSGPKIVEAARRAAEEKFDINRTVQTYVDLYMRVINDRSKL